MSNFFAIRTEDVLPTITSQLSNDNGVVNLASATGVYFYYKDRYLTSGDNTPSRGLGTIVSGAQGIVSYEWAASDTASSNVYRGQWKVFFPNGDPMSFPNDGYMTFEIFDF